MKIEFRIDFGYQYLYSRKHYHPTYVWDGGLDIEDGKIEKIYKLDYPYIWFGPGHSAKETELSAPSWSFKTKREFTGVKIVANVNDQTIFYLHTASVCAHFSAKDIIEKGRIEIPVGPKYLGCYVIITKDEYLWFRRPLKEDETEFSAKELSLPVHNFARMDLAFLAPGESAKWEYEVKEKKCDLLETLLHVVAMATPEYTGGKEIQVRGFIPLELYCDGKLVASFKHYFRYHDVHMQLLEDVWERVNIKCGMHKFELKNVGEELYLGINRISMKPCEYNHGQLSIPEWALTSEKLVGKVYAIYNDVISISELGLNIDCVPGWNEFQFNIKTGGVHKISTKNHSVDIEIFDVKEEKYPVKVGYDMTTVPHDNTGYMDWILDYTSRTRLGNYVVFRNFNGHVDSSEWHRYGKFCKEHGIYVSSCSEESYKDLVMSSGEMFNDAGKHEYSGVVYARDPADDKASETMKEASEKLTEYYRAKIEEIYSVAPRAAFGDASGAIRNSFIAGVDLVRAETMVPHTMTLLSQTRPAAEALGEGRWGVHIAIQHAYQPYHENHLGQYFLSLMQPWVMGAEIIYEEDSLFNLFKEERQAWDDLLTGGKRDMTRNFFKFVKTHPRRGQNTRNIAYLEGRYAAPFNGFICDTEQDPHYSVYGAFGNKKSSWGHGQPEKARQLLDVLMPGASTHPLRQKFDKRRFYFSGTPHGDFDCAPIEADVEYLKKYKLILNLGWNTAIGEDIDKLREYVSCGGILLIGLPEFSKHEGRDFLCDMEDLNLVENKVLRDFCGISVNGRGELYSGYWNSANREKIKESELSALPSDSLAEDGLAYLADVSLEGAEVVAWDYYTAKPMLVKYPLGKGFVYTFTMWAYAGHETFQSFAATWIEKIAREVNSDISIDDPSREIFYTVWKEENETTVMLLNTDWTVKGNIKDISVNFYRKKINLSIKERRLTMLKIKDNDYRIEDFEI